MYSLTAKLDMIIQSQWQPYNFNDFVSPENQLPLHINKFQAINTI